MCDCRIVISSWDLSIVHEMAADLQLRGKSCSESQGQSFRHCPTENFFRLCFFFFFGPVSFLPSFPPSLLSSLFSLSLSLPPLPLPPPPSLLPAKGKEKLFPLLSGKVHPQITFLLDSSFSVLKWPTYSEVNLQGFTGVCRAKWSSAPTEADLTTGGGNGSTLILVWEERVAPFYGVPVFFLKRSFRSSNRDTADKMSEFKALRLLIYLYVFALKSF